MERDQRDHLYVRARERCIPTFKRNLSTDRFLVQDERLVVGSEGDRRCYVENLVAV